MFTASIAAGSYARTTNHAVNTSLRDVATINEG